MLHPDLRRHLHRVPGTAEWRSVAAVKVVEVFHAHVLMQRGGDSPVMRISMRLAQG